MGYTSLVGNDVTTASRRKAPAVQSSVHSRSRRTSYQRFLVIDLRECKNDCGCVLQKSPVEPYSEFTLTLMQGPGIVVHSKRSSCQHPAIDGSAQYNRGKMEGDYVPQRLYCTVVQYMTAKGLCRARPNQRCQPANYFIVQWIASSQI